MDDAIIQEKLSAVLREVLGSDDINVTLDMTASDIEGWDSLNHIRIVLSVEEKFGVRFSTTEIPELRNVGEFVALIKTKLRAARPKDD